jgi:hypothetical protein
MHIGEVHLFSTLCVTENRAGFMPWLLWNYERQTWGARELVIVDSSAVPYVSERADVRVVAAPPGTGVAAKRNLALQQARGTFVTWFDDDDWQHPEKLALLAAALAEREVLYAGAQGGWFVDLGGGRCARYRGRGRMPIFNSAGFRTAIARSERFPESLRKATDTRWLQGLARRYPAGGRLLEREELFFWLCHEANLSNPATRRRYPQPLAVLKELVGAAWGDTEAALEGLRERLAAEQGGKAQMVKQNGARQRRRTRAVADQAIEPAVKESEMTENPAVSVMIKATVLDAPTLDVMARHMIGQAKYPFVHRAIVVERRAGFAGKYRQRARATDADLDRVLEGLLAAQVIDAVHEVDAQPAKVRAVMGRYFARDAERVPTHAVTGGPIYATLFGLEQMPSDLVLQMDADVFFYSGGESWVAQALRGMARDPQLWLMMAHPGPPAGPPGASLGSANRRRAQWDEALQLWRFRTATTRYFLADRRRLRGALLPVLQGNGCRPLEQCISRALQANQAYRGSLGDLQSWHLHAWSHAEPFPQWAAALADLIAAGKHPALQRGKYDLRLDRADSRRAWQALLPAPEPETAVEGKPAAVAVPARQRVKAAVQPATAPLAVIIPVRDRAGRRVRNALHSLNWQTAGHPAQILVVSQGSQPAVDEELGTLCAEAGATLLTTGKPEAAWNKPRALNVGIRAVRPEVPYLMTMDADMILAPNFFEVAIERLRQEPALILCRSLDLPQGVRVPAPAELHDAYERLRRRARPRGRSGTGGIQAARRDFFFQVHGYDEDLLWWGAMDGDMVRRAELVGLNIVWVDGETSMLHQWHRRKHRGLEDRQHVAQARAAWTQNHELVRQRAQQPVRNPAGWGNVAE